VVTVPRGKCVLYVYNPRDEMPYGDFGFAGRGTSTVVERCAAAVLESLLAKYGMPMVFCPGAGRRGDQPGEGGLDHLKDLQNDAERGFRRECAGLTLCRRRQSGSDAFSEGNGLSQ